MKQSKDMKVIGITGGVGSGKSALLTYMKETYNCVVILADEAAHELEAPGQPCYEMLVGLLSPDILNGDGTIDKGKMARKIFRSGELLEKVNDIIHPAVRKMILGRIAEEREKGQADFLFLEAALLIENGYLDIVDEMWYIYAEEEVRRSRLRETRHYPDEKIDAIMKSQLDEETFRKNCCFVIDNSGKLAEAYRQIDRKLGGRL